ncbi:hypothetical protein M2454_002900 [Aequitasia blattaphilus]
MKDKLTDILAAVLFVAVVMAFCTLVGMAADWVVGL